MRLDRKHYYNSAIDAIDRPEGATTAERPARCELCRMRRPLPIVFPNCFRSYGLSRYKEDYYWQTLCGPCDDLVGML